MNRNKQTGVCCWHWKLPAMSAVYLPCTKADF